MRFMSKRRSAILAVGLTGLFAALATPAVAADNGEYPTDPGARTFNGGLNGWTSSSSVDGVCVPPVLCPTVTNSYVSAGDADGNGYIASEYLGVAGAGTVAGTATGVWESPAFTYRSAGGEPETAYLSLSRRADVAQLLAVAGNSADYAVRLIDASEGGRAVTAIAPTTMAGAQSWTTVPRVAIKAGRLHSGDSYRVRIESAYRTGTSAVVTGSADYDNVVLRTAAAEAANGSGGGNGGNGNGGRSTLRSARLLSLFSSGQSNTATVTGMGAGKGAKLRVRVACPKRIGAACRVVAQGLLRRHRPATAKRLVRLGRGRSRLVALKVKPRARARVAKRRRLLVRERVRVGKASATAYKVRKLVRR